MQSTEGGSTLSKTFNAPKGNRLAAAGQWGQGSRGRTVGLGSAGSTYVAGKQQQRSRSRAVGAEQWERETVLLLSSGSAAATEQWELGSGSRTLFDGQFNSSATAAGQWERDRAAAIKSLNQSRQKHAVARLDGPPYNPNLCCTCCYPPILYLLTATGAADPMEDNH